MFDIMYIIFLIWFVLASILVWYFLIGMIVSEIRSLCYYNKLTKKSSKKISGQSGKEKLTRKHLKMLNKYCKLVKAYENDPLFRFDVACMQKYKPGGIFGPLSDTERFTLRAKQYGESLERKSKPVTLPSFEFGVKFITDTYRYIYVKISYWHSNKDRPEGNYPQEALYLGKPYLDMLYVVSEAVNDFVRRYGITYEFQCDTVTSGYSRFTEKEIKRAVKIIDSPEFKKDEAQT